MKIKQNKSWFSHSIEWLTVYLIFFATLATRAAANYPQEGTFAEKADYIDTLPKECAGIANMKLNSVLEAEDPFRRAADLGQGTEVERHHFNAAEGIAQHRVSKNGQDELKLFIGGEGNGHSPMLFKMRMNKDGLLDLISKEAGVSVHKYGERMKENHDAFVAKVETDDGRTCVNYDHKPRSPQAKP